MNIINIVIYTTLILILLLLVTVLICVFVELYYFYNNLFDSSFEKINRKINFYKEKYNKY